MTRTLFTLKLRLFAHGPHNERAFSLVTGLVLAALLIAATLATTRGLLHEGWIALALTVWGALWLVGPLAQPRHDPSVISLDWLRGYPLRPWPLSRALSWTELMGVGPLITLAALSCLTVLAWPGGPAAITTALVATPAQLYLLVWAGKTVSALTARLLQTRAGTTLAATQTALMLAVSFAGWVPVAAWLLPRLGQGETTLTTPTLQQPPPALLEVLTTLPTGWGYAATTAARDGAGAGPVLLPLAALVVLGALLHLGWIALTARALALPPRRASPNRPSKAIALTRARTGPTLPWVDVRTSAVLGRELATWLRDPARGVELRSAWITPLLMVLIVAPTDWNWVLPLIGVAAATLGAMVAINTYALDGTALWQTLTTPGAMRADVSGRMAAWALLFGAPSVLLTLVLWAVSASPLGPVALGATVAAAAAGCAAAPLLALVMPAVGTDARDRLYPGQQAGDATGAQMTVFPLVVVAAIVPGTFTSLVQAPWWVGVLSAVVLGALVLRLVPSLTVRVLERRGTDLLDAMASRDAAALRPTGHGTRTR